MTTTTVSEVGSLRNRQGASANSLHEGDPGKASWGWESEPGGQKRMLS